MRACFRVLTIAVAFLVTVPGIAGADGESTAYVDENGSGQWEADVGKAGNGGAGDVVIYTVRATYTPLFKIPFMSETWNSRTMTASAVKKNQPFGDQAALATTAGTCTA